MNFRRERLDLLKYLKMNMLRNKALNFALMRSIENDAKYGSEGERSIESGGKIKPIVIICSLIQFHLNFK